MKKLSKLIGLCFAVLSPFIEGKGQQSLKNQFQHLLDSFYQINPEAVGIMVHIESPDNHISWTSALGVSNHKTNEKLDPNQPVLIASNTKTYVAAATLKLVEEGTFQLDDPIDKLISSDSRKLLKIDQYALDQITVRHLLSHTSGIADYVNKDYFEFVQKNPTYEWTREEQIRRSVEVGDPLAKAGERFKYADINYLLLTEIIERKTEKPFYQSIRELIAYKDLKLNSTWFINLEDQPGESLPLANQYSDKHNLKSQELNPSWDLYGGGGLAATTKDVALFFQNLFEGKIIRDKKLLSQLTSYVLPQEESNYCLGLRKIPFHEIEAFYHGGFWGTDVMYIPELNTSIAIFTLQKDQRGLNVELNYELLKLLNGQN